MLASKVPLFVVAVVFLVFVRVNAQEHPILENTDLYERLIKHQDPQYPVGKPFASEPIDCLYYDNAIVDHVTSDQFGAPQILLTSVPTTFASNNLFPNILHLDTNGVWMRTPIPVTTDGWTHIHRSTDNVHLLLAMDNIPESSGWETRFVLSDDGGNSWQYGASIRKYVYFDVIRYFTMNESGVGTAIEHYEGDVGGYEQAGYYIYKTYDWGHTWSDPKYEMSYDIADYVEVYELIRSRRAARRPLNEITLPHFDSCSEMQ